MSDPIFIAPAVLFTESAAVAAPAVAFDEGNPPEEAKNTYNLPTGEPLRNLLVRMFGRQRASLFDQLDETLANPVPLPPLEPDTQAIAKAAVPVLRALWDAGGTQAQQELVGTLEADLDDYWDVQDPNVLEAIERAAFDFAESTNQTTSLQIDDARAALRRELAAGLYEQGETLPELRKRVQAVFTSATDYRADRIARTEASRAVHAGTLASYEQSGVVAGVEALISEDSCPLCRRIVAEAPRVRLGEKFATIGGHPVYSDIRHPPFHVHCTCTIVAVLLPEYGGPDDPEWAEPLDQPMADPDYEPPPGRSVPDPEPGRKQVT